MNLRLKSIVSNKLVWLLLLHSNVAFAQEPGLVVSPGLWTDSFLSEVSGKSIVVAGNSSLPDVTSRFVKEITESMYASKKFTVVMDAAPLGDLTTLADTERLKKAAELDVALACIVSAFKAPGAARVVIKCVRRDGGRIEYVGTATDPNSFFLNKTVDIPRPLPKGDTIPNEAAKEIPGANVIALNVLTTTKSIAYTLEKRTHEGARQMLVLSPTRTEHRRIVAGVGEPIRQDVFYELIGKPEFAKSYRRKSTLKTTLFISSASALALGVGFLFVGLAANSNCGQPSCKNTIIPAVGGVSLGLGAIGITWGFLIRKYPTSKDEDQSYIEEYNDKL